MIEPRLNELKGSSRLALGFFNSLIRRIECTKPIAGDGVTIDEKSDGMVISLDGRAGSGASVLNAVTVALNVCSNGAITTIYVYVPAE